MEEGKDVLDLIRKPVKHVRTSFYVRHDYLWVLRVYAARYNVTVSRLLNDIIANAILEDAEMRRLLREYHGGEYHGGEHNG